MVSSRKKKKRKKSRYKRGNYVSPIAGDCKYRSGWELKYMEYLDSDFSIKTWSYEKLVIEYVSNKRTMKVRKYYPDFQVEYKDGTKVIIEIKPSRKLNQDTIKKKTSAAQEWCSKHGVIYKIITEIELKDMGLL